HILCSEYLNGFRPDPAGKSAEIPVGRCLPLPACGALWGLLPYSLTTIQGRPSPRPQPRPGLPAWILGNENSDRGLSQIRESSGIDPMTEVIPAKGLGERIGGVASIVPGCPRCALAAGQSEATGGPDISRRWGIDGC